MVAVYPNQKIATVHKAPADTKHIYGVLNKQAAFNALQNLTFNEARAFLYLSLNQPEYTLAVSTADMAANLGSTEDGMRKALQGLIKKGYLVQNKGRNYDFYEDPYDVASTDKEQSGKKIAELPHQNEEINTGNPIVCPDKNEGEIIQNNTLKNTIKYNTGDLSSDLSSDWKPVFDRIKVQCFPQTIEKISKAAGCTPDYRVIKRIISQNWAAFEKGLDKNEGYRLNTLANLVGSQYKKWENAIRVEDAEYLREREEAKRKPRINYDKIYRKEPEQEGLGDISALLDEMFADVD